MTQEAVFAGWRCRLLGHKMRIHSTEPVECDGFESVTAGLWVCQRCQLPYAAALAGNWVVDDFKGVDHNALLKRMSEL